MNYKDYIRVIPDYPQPGVQFKDITTLLNNGEAYRNVINDLADYVKTREVDLIAGPEARGFVVGAPLAYSLGVGFVPIRKSGKLPSKVVTAEYSLEYGKDTLAVHEDAIKPGQKVLIADDLLATGGTILTTINLIEQLGGVVVGAAFMIELTYLKGRDKLTNYDLHSLIKY
ncbi:MAG: adenine phosphoribosyltransferase [Bacilli bacterium]